MEKLSQSSVVGGGNRELAVETQGLLKRYGSTVAVNRLDLGVSRGGVYGFLGPNGSGKTTTLKMLIGLVEPTSGSLRVLGEEPGTLASLSRVGALVESPDFYPYLSGGNNLKIAARCSGVPASRAEEVLRQVGLQSRGKDAFRKYSLGMKQRLGVAAALLKNPELLILDEPANGLDAKGMTEMRSLLRNLGEEGRTVLFSSHLMGEVEQICDRVGVVKDGQLVAEGDIAELQSQGGLEIKAEPLNQACQLAAGVTGVEEARIAEGKLWLSTDPEVAPEVVHALDSAGVRVSEVRSAGLSLEELFLRLTEDADSVDGRV